MAKESCMRHFNYLARTHTLLYGVGKVGTIGVFVAVKIDTDYILIA